MIEKIFKAYDVRATYPNPLNEESAWKVGHATAQYLKRSRQNAEQKVWPLMGYALKQQLHEAK